MKIQSSKNGRQTDKDYSAVCHQQGRMLIDTDLTEQALLARDRLDQALRDVIGSGSPRHDGVLQVTKSSGMLQPSLHWGLVYVDGIRAQVRAADTAPDADLFAYDHQLYYPQAPALTEGGYRLYVDVWERPVIWLQDDALRDPGLHGADTTVRSQTVAQVKSCAADLDPMCPDTNPTKGDALLKLTLRSLSSSADPCDPCADELELHDAVGNYLFRTEVHDVGYDENDQPQRVVLKWSSENGAEAYRSTDVPPGFASSEHVYEFFDELTELRQGTHLARDPADLRMIDGSRPPLVNEFQPTSPMAREFVRRWDGWCVIEKTAADWQLVSGREGRIALPATEPFGKPGHVEQGGASLRLELRLITLDIELGDHALLAGDYWTAAVRESIHQQGSVLLAADNGIDGAEPEGIEHHYLHLVEVSSDDVLTLPGNSACDGYQACMPAQFPSLTDLRADDVCYDNSLCTMPEVRTVQEALDHLCQERDLRWHNRQLHGWGIVCGLTLECNPKNADTGLWLRSGYALDCDGTDLILDADKPLDMRDVLQQSDLEKILAEKEAIVCLYLDKAEQGELVVRAEPHDPGEDNWFDRLQDTLLMDFYQDCILELVQTLKGELRETDIESRCALTDCGRKLITPFQRRTLTLGNLLLQYNEGDKDAVLNLSACEHALLHDLYLKLQDLLRSKTFCAQFRQAPFPDYPFKAEKQCRATWFTPEQLDQIRVHPNGKMLLGWRRDDPRLYVFQMLDKGCTGDLVAVVEVPEMANGSISDLVIDGEVIYLTAILHQEDTLLARGRLRSTKPEDCSLDIEWTTSFLCGVRVVQLKASPWSEKQLYAVGLCRGVYLLDKELLFDKQKLELEPDWSFAASGHLDFDLHGGNVFATAASGKDCESGIYDQLAVFSEEPGGQVVLLDLSVAKQPVRGMDGFVIRQASALGEGAKAAAEGQTPVFAAGGALFLVGGLEDEKRLFRFDPKRLNLELDGKQGAWEGELYHLLGNAGHVSLLYLQQNGLDGVVASRYLGHELHYVPGEPKQYPKGVLTDIPVQAGPVNLVSSDKAETLYVLNHLGQSVTVLDYRLQAYEKQRDALAAYRQEVIAAFYALLANLLQYLKDCFCHHLLVQCPSCDEDDKVYLGCVEIRDSQVYNVCNFSKRKYVKSFPTISYWLSLIPIGPLFDWLIEQVCCLVLPNFFAKKEDKKLSLNMTQFGAIQAFGRVDTLQMISGLGAQTSKVMQTGVAGLFGGGRATKASYQEVVGQQYRYKPGVYQQVQSAPAKDSELQKRMDILELEKMKAQREVDVLKQQVDMLQSEKQAYVTQMDAMNSQMQELKLMGEQLRPLVLANKSVATIDGITTDNVKILEQANITTVKQLSETSEDRLKELGMHHSTAKSLITKAGETLK